MAAKRKTTKRTTRSKSKPRKSLSANPRKAGSKGPGRKQGDSNWTEQDIDRGIESWLRLRSSEQAARETGIPATTLRTWRASRPGRFISLSLSLSRELQAAREETAQATAAGVMEGVEEARRAMRGEGTIPAKDSAALLKALSMVDASLDRSKRLDDGSPTEIVDDRRTDDELAQEIEMALADPKMRATFAHEDA